MLKRTAHKIGKLFGLVIVPDWRAIRLDEERHLARLFKTFDIDCVFDVGANVGQYGRMLRENCGYRRRIISFEPHPAAIPALQQAAARDELWSVQPFALGNQEGVVQFQAYERSELGSFLSFSDSDHAPKALKSIQIPVQVRRLEQVFAEQRAIFEFKRPFLKLDTQGFDVEVAKSAGPMLREFRGIQSEIAFQNIYANAPGYREAIDFYAASGFALSRLVPLHDANFPDLVEMDAILLRRDLMLSRS